MASEQGETLHAHPSSLPELRSSTLAPLFPLTLFVHLGVSLGVRRDPLNLRPSRLSGKARGAPMKGKVAFYQLLPHPMGASLALQLHPTPTASDTAWQ